MHSEWWSTIEFAIDLVSLENNEGRCSNLAIQGWYTSYGVRSVAVKIESSKFLPNALKILRATI
jgi:hypothetical protein